MNTKSNAVQEAIRNEYGIKFDWSLTLTYRNTIENVDTVNKHIKQLFDHLRRKVIGKSRLRYSNEQKHLMMIGAIERHADNSIHLHINLTNPPKSVAKEDTSSDLLKNIYKEALYFWEDKKRHSIPSSSGRETNKVEPLMTLNESRTMLQYITKYTSQQNSNTFIAYWDSDIVALPTTCLR